MMVTKEAVEKRLERLRADHDRLLAQVNATIGAINEAEHWLSVLEKPGADMKLVPEAGAMAKQE